MITQSLASKNFTPFLLKTNKECYLKVRHNLLPLIGKGLLRNKKMEKNSPYLCMFRYANRL